MNMKFSPTVKWILGGFGIFVLLFLCIAPLMVRMVFMRVGGGFDTEGFRARRGAFAQERQKASKVQSQRGNQPEQGNTAQSQDEDTFRDGRSGRGHHFGHRGRHGYSRGFSPIRAIFGLFGGLVRLAGLGMLALAAIIWLKPQMDRRQTNRKRDHHNTHTDDDDDNSDSDNNAGQWI